MGGGLSKACRGCEDHTDSNYHLLTPLPTPTPPLTPTKILETPNPFVLLQEFIPGPEFAIDSVSISGVHKIVAVWSYVKTDSGYGPFAYLRTSLVCPSDDATLYSKVCSYVSSCLDALHFKNGLTHTERRIGNDGEPIAVEVNCRQHNANVLTLTRACTGYDAVEVMAEGYFEGVEGRFSQVRKKERGGR